MPTVVVNLTFSSDDGWSEKFEGNASCVNDGAYSSGEGNPAGSVVFTCGASCADYTFKRSDYTVLTTFEDFGVPAGATVTGISNISCEYKHTETGGSNGNNWHDFAVECNYTQAIFMYDDTASSGSDTSYHTPTVQSSYSGQFPLASDAQCAVVIGIDVDIGAGGTAAVYFDNITFTLTYDEAPATTRFYLPSSGTPPLPSLGIGTYWDIPSTDPLVARLPTFTTKQDTPYSTSTNAWDTAGASASWLWWQYQTEPLASQLILSVGDKFNFVMNRCRESFAFADTYLECIIRSVSGDGATVTNELIRFTALGPEFTLTAESRVAVATLVAGFTIAAGDRLIFEIGVYGQTPYATATVDLRVGDPVASIDHDGTNGNTDDLCGYIQTVGFEVDLGGPSSDHQGSGALLSAIATMSGAAVRVAVASGGMVSADALMSGYSYALPGINEEAKDPTTDTYSLYFDGVLTPMFGFKLVRLPGNDSADVEIPAEFYGDLISATTITVEQSSKYRSGFTFVTELFSLTLVSTSRTKERLTARLQGTPAAPVNAVRKIDNVSFIADDSNYFAFRTRIDERFWPGDVCMYGSRRLDVNRVTIIVNSYQPSMELAELGQV